MSVVHVNSISGITSITTPSSSDVLTLHTSNNAERLRINSSGNVLLNGGSFRIDGPGEFAVFENDTSLSFNNSAQISLDFSSNVARLRSTASGSGTNRPLALCIGSSEKLRISSAGKVGIGTTDPKQPVSIVNGRVSIDVNNDYYGVWADGDTAGENHISVGRWYNTGGGLKSGYTAYGINNLILENNHATAAHSLIIQPKGQKVAIGTHITDGLVHIGQHSAGSVSANAGGDELVLESNGNTGMSILSPGTGESTIFFGNPGTNGERDAYIRYWHESHGTAANQRCLTIHTAGGDTERLRIDSDGKIGMGVVSTSPGGTCNPDGNTLLIRAASTFQTTKGHIMLSGDGATNGEGPQIVFSESGSGGNYAGAYVGHVRTGSNSIGDLVFGTRATGGDASTVPTERLRITADGHSYLAGRQYLARSGVAPVAGASNLRETFFQAIATGASHTFQISNTYGGGLVYIVGSRYANANIQTTKIYAIAIRTTANAHLSSAIESVNGQSGSFSFTVAGASKGITVTNNDSTYSCNCFVTFDITGFVA